MPKKAPAKPVKRTPALTKKANVTTKKPLKVVKKSVVQKKVRQSAAPHAAVRMFLMVAMVVLALATVAYCFTVRQSTEVKGYTCADLEELDVLSDACEPADQVTGMVQGSSCTDETVGEEAVACPAQETLGATTNKTGFVWPIKLANWPKLKIDTKGTPTKIDDNVISPVANCDLLYGKVGNETVSTGVEIAVPVGTPVYSSTWGRVVYSQGGTVIAQTYRSYNRVDQEHVKTVYVAYQYLKDRTVKVGDKLIQSQLIGHSGSGGAAAELPASLHFGTWLTGDLIGGHPLLYSAAGNILVHKLVNPVYFMLKDGRSILGCKSTFPWNVPGPTFKPVAHYAIPFWPVHAPYPNSPLAKCFAKPSAGKPGYAGIDINVPVDTPVYSALEGKVVASGYGTYAGNYVIIEHPKAGKNGATLWTNYQHLTQRNVKVGTKVQYNQQIGTSGNTGLNSKTVLRFGITNKKALDTDTAVAFSIDPLMLLTTKEFAYCK